MSIVLLSVLMYKVFKGLKLFCGSRFAFWKGDFLSVVQFEMFWTVLFYDFCELIFVIHKALMPCKVMHKVGWTKRFHNISSAWNSLWMKNCEDGNKALKDLNRSHLSISFFSILTIVHITEKNAENIQEFRVLIINTLSEEEIFPFKV